jgi:hypothetical protein
MCQLGILVRATIHSTAVHREAFALSQSVDSLILRHSREFEWTQQDGILLIKSGTEQFASR